MLNAPEARSRWEKLWPLPVLLALLVDAAISFREIADGDAGWHLAFGRLIAEHGVQFRNALSWTAPDYHWYPTSWFYDLASFRLVSAFGPGGMQAITFTCVALTLGALTILCRRVQPLLGVWVVLAISLLMLPRIVARPQVVSWAVLAWVLVFCWKQSWRWRAAATAIIAVGSNFHSGAAFATGVLGIFCLEAAIRERAWLREAGIVVVSVLALTLNPGGVSNIRYLIENLHANSVLPIVEMMPATPAREPVFFAVLALTILCVALTRRHWANVAAAALFAVLALKATRFVFEFYIVAAPLLTAGAAELFSRKRALALAYLGSLCILGLLYGRVAFDQYRFGPSFDLHGLPIRASSFIAAEGIRGKVFNGYHDGGQLAWSFPDLPVYLDGRLQAYPEAFIEEERSAERSPEAFQRRMKQQGIEWAVTGAYGKVLTGDRLFDTPDWALVYWDEVNEVFLRRDVPRFAGIIARNEFRYFTRARPPDQTIVRTLQTATPEVLRAYEAELDRHDAYSPGWFLSLLARCIIATKEERPDMSSVCARADAAPH